jgi:hypothetical protein
LVLVAGAAPDPATAQSRTKAFGLESIDGYVELAVRGRNHDRNTPTGGKDFTKTELFIDEILNLDLDGFVYHPNLVSFSGGLKLHFLQDALDSDAFFLPGGHARLSFLDRKPYGFKVFARVTENEFQQRFAPTVGVRTVIYGAGVRLDRGPLPMEVVYTHRDREQGGEPCLDCSEIGDEVTLLGSYELGEGSQGDVRYRFDDVRVVNRDQRTTRHELFANNTTYFGSDRRKRFSGLGRLLYSSGMNNTSTATLSGGYDWEHSGTLSSSYHLSYQHQALESHSSNNYGLAISLFHGLYGSVSTGLSAYGNVQDASFGLSSQYGARLQERYSKKLGEWGRLKVEMEPFVEVQHQRPDQLTGFVLDEGVIFGIGNRVVPLRRTDIDTATIVARHPACRGADDVCDPEFDYRIRAVPGGLAELEHVITGDIPLDEEVLVQYEYRLREDSDVLVYGYRSDVEIAYRGWGSLFANIRYSREDGLGGTTVDRLRPTPDRQAVGVRVNRRWVSGVVMFEREENEIRTSLGNFQTVTLTTPWSTWWNGSLAASHRARDWDNPSEEMVGWRVTGRWNARLGGRGRFEIRAEYDKEDWSGNQTESRNFDAIFVGSTFEWRFRAFQVMVGGGVYFLDRRQGAENHERFYVRLRRNF